VRGKGGTDHLAGLGRPGEQGENPFHALSKPLIENGLPPQAGRELRTSPVDGVEGGCCLTRLAVSSHFDEREILYNKKVLLKKKIFREKLKVLYRLRKAGSTST